MDKGLRMSKKIYIVFLILFLFVKFDFSSNPDIIHYKIFSKSFSPNAITVKLLVTNKNATQLSLKGKFRQKNCRRNLIIKNIKINKFDIGLIFDKRITKEQIKKFKAVLLKAREKGFNFYFFKKNNKPVNFLSGNINTLSSNELPPKRIKKYSFYIFVGYSPFLTQIKFLLSKKKEKIWTGYITINGRLVHKKLYKNTFFDFRFDQNLTKNLRNFFLTLTRSYFSVDFKPCYTGSQNIAISIQVISKKRKIGEFPLNITIPDSLWKIYKIQYIQTKIDKLIAQKKYKAALELLYKNKSTLKTKYYNYKVKSAFTLWADYLQKYKNTSQVFVLVRSAEKKFRLSHKNWYAKLKILLLKDALQYQKTDEGKFKIIKILVKLLPENREIRYQYYKTQAVVQNNNGNIWLALTNYLQAQKIKSDPNIVSKINSLLIDLFRTEYKDHEYGKIFAQGEKFNRYLKNNFELIFYYAKSCQKTLHFKKALTSYELIFENWEKNKFISWAELIRTLQNISLLNFQFDQSYNYLKRAYRLNNDSDLLNLAVALLRAKYLYSYLLFFKRTFDLAQIQLNHRILKKLYKKNFAFFKYSLSNNNQTGYPFEIILNDNDLNLICRINKQKIKLTLLSSKKTAREKELINNIQKFPNDEEFWDKLYSYEYFNNYDNTGIKVLSYLLTKLFGYKLDAINLGDYENILRKVPYLKYIVAHNKQGEILSALNFDKSLAHYPKNGWQKSSRTLGFFKQTVLYGKTQIIDIAIPIYSASQWKGAVRFGFLKSIF